MDGKVEVDCALWAGQKSDQKVSKLKGAKQGLNHAV